MHGDSEAKVINCELCGFMTKNRRQFMELIEDWHDEAEGINCELCGFMTDNRAH